MKFSVFIFQTHNCTVICCVVTVFFQLIISTLLSVLYMTLYRLLNLHISYYFYDYVLFSKKKLAAYTQLKVFRKNPLAFRVS